jgi:hypothetical protein
MDCTETRTRLIAFHDGELPGDERTRVEAHLDGCAACRALLADLSRIDGSAGVPDPGPEYWDRFNARVMARVAREADGPDVAPLRPKRGWVRQQMRYFIPAVAAAALVVVVVRQAGIDRAARMPAAPAVESAAPAIGPAAPGVESAASVIGPAAPPVRPSRQADGSPARGTGLPASRREAAPAPAGSQPAPQAGFRPALPVEAGSAAPAPAAPTASPRPFEPATAPSPVGGAEPDRWAATAPAPRPADSGGRSPGVFPEDGYGPAAKSMSGKMEQAQEFAARAESLDAMAERKSAKRKLASPGKDAGEWPQAPAAARPMMTASGSAPGSAAIEAPAFEASIENAVPCGSARRLAAQGRLAEAERAQRDCLSKDAAPESQETGLLFLAELLDRQARFAEADRIVAEVGRRFPQSRRLDRYRQQRPSLQKPAPGGR